MHRVMVSLDVRDHRASNPVHAVDRWVMVNLCQFVLAVNARNLVVSNINIKWFTSNEADNDNDCGVLFVGDNVTTCPFCVVSVSSDTAGKYVMLLPFLLWSPG